MRVHDEPSEFKRDTAENCALCGVPTRTWLDPHTPMCQVCANHVTHTGFRLVRAKPCEKCSTITFWAVKVGDRLAPWCGCDNTTKTAKPIHLELPRLWGTPKQVQYAETMRKQMIGRWSPRLAEPYTVITDATWWIANKACTLEQVQARHHAVLDPASYDYRFSALVRRGVQAPWFARRYGDNKCCFAIPASAATTVTTDPWGFPLTNLPDADVKCRCFSNATSQDVFVDLVVSS